jgi:CBS domain-containing protein
MQPVDQIVTCTTSDSIESVVDKVLNHHISAVIVVRDETPVGIVTKTDLTRAFRHGYALDKTVDSVMSTAHLLSINKNVPHDAAAGIFNANKVHHAIVVDDEGNLTGVVTAWDVAREGWLDNKAWPWNRHALM